MNDQQYSGSFVLTADVGGSHITSAICNIENGKLIKQSSARVAIMSKSSAENILLSWKKCFDRSLASIPDKICGMTIAMPGPFDYENGISYIKGLNKYEAFYGMDIGGQLAEQLQLPRAAIKFRNDAEATVAGEVLAGAGAGYNNVMGVTLGTGFGSAHFKDNRTIDLNLGSEKFKNSIADDYLSTRWFVKSYYELSGLAAEDVKDLATIASVSPIANDIFSEFAKNMSNFLMEPVFLLNPDLLIICGNIAKAHQLFLPHLQKRLKVPIKTAELGEEAPLIGAAALFKTYENFIPKNNS